jgi:hypothetical protein
MHPFGLVLNRGWPVDPIWLDLFGDAGAKIQCYVSKCYITHPGRASTAQSHRSNCRGILPIT